MQNHNYVVTMTSAYKVYSSQRNRTCQERILRPTSSCKKVSHLTDEPILRSDQYKLHHLRLWFDDSQLLYISAAPFSFFGRVTFDTKFKRQ